MRAVLQYTAKKWGKGQAQKYYDALMKQINLLPLYPELGVKKDNVRGNYRSLACESHFIFYRVFDDEIRIARLLHKKAHYPDALN